MGNLNSLLILMTAYFYTDFLYVYFYEKTLGFKYSRQITLIATFCMWVCDCSMKLIPQYLWGLDQTGIVSLVMLTTTILYAVVLYNGSIIKCLLATAVYMVVQIAMDMLGMQLATVIVGDRELFETIYVIASVFCSGITITLGTVVCAWVWRKVEERNWKVDGYQWFSLLLPVSQYAVLQYVGMEYAGKLNTVSVVVVIGIVLGLLGDIYMFWLLERINAKKYAEEEMRKLSYQYELEKLKYEQLKAMQEETAKMRHEMQNYLLTIKNME